MIIRLGKVKDAITSARLPAPRGRTSGTRRATYDYIDSLRSVIGAQESVINTLDERGRMLQSSEVHHRDEIERLIARLSEYRG
jgi:hypothetical protein